MELDIHSIYYYKVENICKGIEIRYNDNGFIIKGKNKHLYNFLSSNIGVYLLVNIWEDNRNPTQDYTLTTYEYNNHFKVEKIDTLQECSICQQHIREGIKTKCKHYFHCECLKRWLTNMCNKPTCPNCRNSLDVYSLS